MAFSFQNMASGTFRPLVDDNSGGRCQPGATLDLSTGVITPQVIQPSVDPWAAKLDEARIPAAYAASPRNLAYGDSLINTPEYQANNPPPYNSQMSVGMLDLG